MSTVLHKCSKELATKKQYYLRPFQIIVRMFDHSSYFKKSCKYCQNYLSLVLIKQSVTKEVIFYKDE